MAQSKWKGGLGFFALLTALTLFVGLLWPSDDSVEDVDEASADSSTTTTTTEPSPEEDARECADTWLIVQSDNENNRWFADGLREIEEADTDEEAREAAETWLRLVRRDPQLLAGASAYFLDRQVDWATLMTPDGKCASEAAETLTAEIELAIAQARVTPEDAPSDGVNSGVNADGNVVAASHDGITGNRAAVKVELKNGKILWLMARCGNPVVKGPAPVPPGPTDQPPPPPPPENPPPEEPPPPPGPKCPDGSPVPPNGLCPKNPEESVNNNPDVPDQVKKTQPSPDNQTEANKPPREPVDSPTGCTDRCDEDDGFAPTTTAAPSPTQGQGDSGEGTTNTTSPPTTQAPAPAPPTTASPSPSTTNPPPPPG